MLFVPTTYKPIKAGLLAVVLLMIAIQALLRGRLALHPTVLLWMLFIVSVGLIFMLRGLINGTPGALRSGTVFVLWPLVFTILAAGASNERVLQGLIRVAVVAMLAIGLYSLSYILYVAGWLPDTFYIPIDQGQAIGFYEGYIEYRLYNISSLLFLVPFFIAALLTSARGVAISISHFWLWVALILGLMLSLLSGRRVLQLIVVIAPIITLFFCIFLPQTIKRVNRKQIMRAFAVMTVAVLGLVICLQSIYGFSLLAVVERVFSRIDESLLIRKEQFSSLLAAWAESPLLGAGLGASVPSVLRSKEMPWAYELSYVALLFHTGLLGFLAYAAAVAWIFWMGLRMIRSGGRMGLYMLPILVGTTCFLIGNATNPYLGKFDYMWVIFLPVAFINFWLLKRRKKGASSSITTSQMLGER